MQQFVDKEGHEWTVELDISAVMRTKSLIDIDLTQLPFDAELRTKVMQLETFADVLYCVCKPQADHRGLSSYEFGTRLDMNALRAAAKAMEREVDLFFSSQASYQT